ncbi:MAG: FtsW/RodA/SpoVE family cell cycle protein [Clostridiales bacterium]|nr:FtsW/RodA/SpoVE family cell cycle protein [Clostridiales bacterium]
MGLFSRKNDKKAIEAYRKLISRAYETPLLVLIMVFQFLSMGLMAFKDGDFDLSSLLIAVALPLGTWALTYGISKLIHADRGLIMLTAFLAGLGVITLRAALSSPAKAFSQAGYLPLGCAFMLLGALTIHYIRVNGVLVWLLMAICAALMVMPFAFTTVSSAKSWIRLAGYQMQPSEFVKPALVVILAYGFTRGSRINDWFVYAVYSAVLCVILLVQRDLGAVLLYFMLTTAMFTVGTGRWKLALAALVLAVAVGAVFVSFADRIPGFSYLAARIEIWRDPWNSQREDSRQIVQGLMSISSGGLFGAGLGLSAARKVAVVASDYIFAAVCEEFGIVFAFAVICVYVLILLRGCGAAMSARGRFFALAAFGGVFELTSQMLLIVMGNLHIVPLTGVTLPFVSEGGSSLCGSMLLMGLVLGVSALNAKDEYDDLNTLESRGGRLKL